MKKQILIALSMSLILVAGVSAQSKNELKGPKAKNYKVWEHHQAATPVFFKAGETAKGPLAKNQRPLDRKSGQLAVANTNTDQTRLQGPAAKNQKVWEQPSMLAAN